MPWRCSCCWGWRWPGLRRCCFPGLTQASLLPYDNLYTFAPWRALQPGLTPHNDLLADLVLENAVWKQHIRETLAQGEIPLWNPKILTGLPFLAAGQASVFYPLNVLFYVLPLEWAFGWFTALQVALAGINMYLFGRVLGLRRMPALYAGVVYMFSGFLIVSVVFTMFLAAVPWLPLLLAVIEYIIRKQEEKGVASFNPIPYVAVGAAIIGLVVLAGHPELIYYTMLVAGAYTFCRLLAAYVRLRRRVAGCRRNPAHPGDAHPQAGRLAAGDGRAGHRVGRGAVDPAGGTAAAQLPRRLGVAGTGAGMGLAVAPRAHLLAAQHLWQPQPPRLVRHLDAPVDAGHRQRPGRADPHHLLGHQELCRRRQLSGRGDLAAGVVCDLGRNQRQEIVNC